MDFRYNLHPVEVLTYSLIDELVIHTSIDTLNIARGSSAIVKVVPESKSVPTLYYLKKTNSSAINDWSIHALIVDITRFLLNDHVRSINTPKIVYEPSNSELIIRSNQDIKITYDGGIITIDGELIKTSLDTNNEESEDCYQVLLDIIPAKGMIKHFPDVSVSMTYESIEDNSQVTKQFTRENFIGEKNILSIPIIFTAPGQEIPITINWDGEYREFITVALTQESVLKEG